jgi:hypothetical protein
VMIMITMTILIRNLTHQIQVINFIYYKIKMDRPCSLVFLATDTEVQHLIPGITRFSDKSGMEHSASRVQLSSYLKENSCGSGLESQDYGHREPSC